MFFLSLLLLIEQVVFTEINGGRFSIKKMFYLNGQFSNFRWLSIQLGLPLISFPNALIELSMLLAVYVYRA